MPYRNIIILFLISIPKLFTAQSIELPPGFYETEVSAGWNIPVGFTFDETGRMFVWEKAGRVYLADSTGAKYPTPLLDINEEVITELDLGLLGFALDPNFLDNGYFYTAYVVDRHHLLHYGTAAYHPDSTWLGATIGRVTRFTADVNNNFETLIPDSRFVLLGEDHSTGVPIMQKSHSMGTLVFGTDGTLLISAGDGAATQGNFEEEGLADGIMRTEEYTGAFRSQLVNTHSGKILRIDPATGDGLPSNPFYDPDNPRAPGSKVWALGLRNPYRMALRPETGSHFESDGNPGVLFLADVGSGSREELNVLQEGGQNFGWPIYEGMKTQVTYAFTLTPNLDMPNPLFVSGSCNKEYYDYQDLLVQESLNPPNFPNPCDDNQQIVTNGNLFMHNRPAFCYNNDNWSPTTRTLVPSFDDNGAAVEISVLDNDCPVESDTFSGVAIIAGEFYTHHTFPENYQNCLFVSDFHGWIKCFNFNEAQELTSVVPFAEDSGLILHLGIHPNDGCLYYFRYYSNSLFKVCYGGNPPPVAVAESDVNYGGSSLPVNFDASASFDPNNLPLSYNWDFGDGNTSTSINPSHTYTAPGNAPYTFTATLTVTDSLGEMDTDNVFVSLNNSPPQVDITSFEDGDTYPISGTTQLPLIANVVDNEHANNELTYEWQTILHHNTHSHLESTNNNPLTSTLISPLGCIEETYYYRVSLTVTDPEGLVGTDEGFLYPNCNPPFFEIQDINLAASGQQIDINWITAQELNTVYFEIYRSMGDFNFIHIGTVDASGNTNIPTSYAFIDTDPLTGFNTYRLKVFDTDGNYEYSIIKGMDFPVLPNLLVYPNPAKNQVSINFAEINEQAEFKLYNYLGQKVYEANWQATEAGVYEIFLHRYAPGVYIYVVDDGVNTVTEKLIIY